MKLVLDIEEKFHQEIREFASALSDKYLEPATFCSVCKDQEIIPLQKYPFPKGKLCQLCYKSWVRFAKSKFNNIENEENINILALEWLAIILYHKNDLGDLPKYCYQFKDRHGKWRIRVRIGKKYIGSISTKLGTEEFEKKYKSLLEGKENSGKVGRFKRILIPGKLRNSLPTRCNLNPRKPA